MATIDFWYSIGSTYSYLTIMRLPEVARESGVEFRWRPFDVRRIMIAQKNIPFKDKPAKAAYMWRDIERRARRFGLEPRLPAPYPLPELVFANQVAMVAAEQGWLQDYSRATYRRWFEEGLPPGEEPNLSRSVVACGQDVSRVLQEAGSDRVERKLAAETAEAEALGIFGAPSFLIDGELFWGDDRLEDALAWAGAGPKVR